MGFFLDTRGEHLYEQCSKSWYIYMQAPSRCRSLNYHPIPRQIPADDVPTNLQYAKVIQAGNLIMVNGMADIKEEDEESIMYQDDDMVGMHKWGIQLENHGNIQTVIAAINNDIAVAVSDGSFQEQASPAAWTIESETKQHQIL